MRLLPALCGVALSQRGAIGRQAGLILADIGTVRYVSSRVCFPVLSTPSSRTAGALPRATTPFCRKLSELGCHDISTGSYHR
jgi:hypothetical protein